ncbi:hypothetical protein J6590_037935 [Homalodisca vitripennis]|nr:hypothetical protein J6590_037935 [Homalodisca vitripennis]
MGGLAACCIMHSPPSATHANPAISTDYAHYNLEELRLLTLPCLHTSEVILYCLSKRVKVRGGEVHQYETRGRDNLRTQQHRLTLSQHLPRQVGVRLINRVPEGVNNSNNTNQFKARLKRLLAGDKDKPLEGWDGIRGGAAVKWSARGLKMFRTNEPSGGYCLPEGSRLNNPRQPCELLQVEGPLLESADCQSYMEEGGYTVLNTRTAIP